MNSGIYRIVNTVNGKCYVGQTSPAVGFDKRKTDHFSALRRGDHFNKHLQGAYSKYGEESLVYEILEEVKFPDDFERNRASYREYLIPYEQKWIDYYQSADQNFGYNFAPTSGSPLGIKRSDETRKKISDSVQGEKHPHFGRTGDKHPMFGTHHSPEVRQKISDKVSGENHPLYGTQRSDETKRKIGEANSAGKQATRRYIIFHKNGSVHIVRNLVRFCKDKNLLYRGMTRVLEKSRNTHKGYVIRYMTNEEELNYESLFGDKWWVLLEE